MGGENRREPIPFNVKLECPNCGTRLEEHEEFWVGLAKAAVVLVGGIGLSVDIAAIVYVHLWAVVHGQMGLGIDLRWVLAGLFPFLAGIIYWAFPKRGGK